MHRATTKDGRDVAVKVQYPGVDEAIRSDLSNAEGFIKTFGAALGEDSDLTPHLREVAARVGEELDYVTEARTSGSSPSGTADTRTSSSPAWSASTRHRAC